MEYDDPLVPCGMSHLEGLLREILNHFYSSHYVLYVRTTSITCDNNKIIVKPAQMCGFACIYCEIWQKGAEIVFILEHLLEK